VAEQFAFEQCFRNSRTIHSDKRFVTAVANRVNRLSRQFFTGARFATDKHGDITLRDPPQSTEDFLHRSTASDKSFKGVTMFCLFFQQSNLLIGDDKICKVRKTTNSSHNFSAVVCQQANIAMDVKFSSTLRHQFAFLAANTLDRTQVGLGQQVFKSREPLAILSLQMWQRGANNVRPRKPVILSAPSLQAAKQPDGSTVNRPTGIASISRPQTAVFLWKSISMVSSIRIRRTACNRLSRGRSYDEVLGKGMNVGQRRRRLTVEQKQAYAPETPYTNEEMSGDCGTHDLAMYASKRCGLKIRFGPQILSII